MSEESVTDERDEKKGGLGLLAYVPVVLVLLYVLSVGPVAKVVRKMPAPPRVVVVVYGPLEQLARSSPGLQGFFDWYIHDLWKAK